MMRNILNLYLHVIFQLYGRAYIYPSWLQCALLSGPSGGSIAFGMTSVRQQPRMITFLVDNKYILRGTMDDVLP